MSMALAASDSLAPLPLAMFFPKLREKYINMNKSSLITQDCFYGTTPLQSLGSVVARGRAFHTTSPSPRE